MGHIIGEFVTQQDFDNNVAGSKPAHFTVYFINKQPFLTGIESFLHTLKFQIKIQTFK